MPCRRATRTCLLAASLTLGLCAAAAGHDGSATLPPNDLQGQMTLLQGGQSVWPMPVRRAAEPELRAVPPARCDGDSRQLEGLQGRVTAEDLASPAAAAGWTCNVTVVGRAETPGGFRTWRYADRNGHVCAFYDTSIDAPASALTTAAGPSEGVAVLDMADPSRPVRATTLRTAAMLSPHESLNLNERRGLLAAEVGNGLTTPGLLAIYDVAEDCRAPVLLSQLPVAFGHESGWSPDGRTFWVAGGGGEVLAVDVADPRAPRVVWRGSMYSHGLGVGDDGRTLFHTDPVNGTLGILDVGEVQDRRPSPVVREISRITWDSVSVPQNALPVRIAGRPYVLEFDEFAFRFNPPTADDRVGAVRLIDVSDPAHPRIASHLRLEVNQRETHQQVADDPSPLPPGRVFGYSAHYCGVPREVDPQIVACSFVNSGLRVFDISDPVRPQEVAYFVAPARRGPDGAALPNFAMSQPAFDPARREVWYTDSFSGFYALRLSPSAWPRERGACVSRRVVTITLPRGLRAARVRYAGRTARTFRRDGRLRARIDLRGLPARRVVVRITGRTEAGRRVTATRTFRTCRGRNVEKPRRSGASR